MSVNQAVHVNLVLINEDDDDVTDLQLSFGVMVMVLYYTLEVAAGYLSGLDSCSRSYRHR